MRICCFSKNNCFFNAINKSKLKAFFVVLAKTIFTPWSLGNKKIREQWKFVLKKVPKPISIKTNVSSKVQSLKNSVVSSGISDSQLEKDVGSAKKIMQKHKEFSPTHLDDTIEKASQLADLILIEAHKLERFSQLEKDVAEKSKKSPSITVRDLLFRRCFKSLMELKLDETKDDFRKENSKKSTKKLFGDEVFQIKNVKGNVTYLAFQKQVGSGTFNKAFFGFDLYAAKTRVGRRNKNSLKASEIKELQRENAFQQELRLYPELKKNIVKVYAEVYKSSYFGTVLANCDGGDVCTLKEHDQLKGEEKRKIVDDVCMFMRNMHAHGFVYGDFKTDNFFLKNGKLKVGDFGGSYDSTSGKTPGVATPYYVAPEIFDTRNTNIASDRWALGVFLYEMKYTSGSSKRVPAFFDKMFVVLDNLKKTDSKSLKEGLKLIETGINNPGCYLNPADPYDQVIVALLKMDPKKRISAEEAVERLKKVPLSSYSK